MSQVTTGVRAILSSPWLYDFFQNLTGAHKGRTELSTRFIRAQVGDRVLDVGCGTAEILNYLPAVEYVGYDISPSYIASAETNFADRGAFHCKLLTASEVQAMPRFDIVLAIGVLHHLDDSTARDLLSVVNLGLRPGGRLITIDPCLAEDQGRAARFLVKADRGQNVRDEVGYTSLVGEVFDRVQAVVLHRAWIPYTHCIMECTRGPD